MKVWEFKQLLNAENMDEEAEITFLVDCGGEEVEYTNVVSVSLDGVIDLKVE